MTEKTFIEPDVTGPSPRSASAFFPAGAFEQSDRSAAFVAEWYTKHLVAMREPPMHEHQARGEAALRFLWLRTWARPIAVRAVRTDAGADLFIKRASGMGGYGAGSIGFVARLFRGAIQRSVKLGPSAWIQLENVLDRARFDDIGTQPTTLGADGAEWVLEAVRNGKYRIVRRWSPEAHGEDAAFRDACLMFLELAGRDVVDGEIY